MFRQPLLALGLLSLALAFGPLVRPTVSQAADEGAHASATAQAGEAPAGEHGKAADPNILETSSPLAIWTVVVFVILLLVLRAFAWKPLMDALHKREEHMEHTLAEAERAREEAERLLAEHRSQMAQATEQVRALIEKAHKDAEATANDIVRKAQTEAEASRERAERDIAGARDRALLEIWDRTADLAVTVAGRVLSRELGPDDHRRLVEVATHELPASPAANGQGGRA